MTARKRAPACPICGAARRALYRPFCSRRCQEVDLGRWLSGVYAIPAEEPPEDDGAAEEDWDGVPPDPDERG